MFLLFGLRHRVSLSPRFLAFPSLLSSPLPHFPSRLQLPVNHPASVPSTASLLFCSCPPPSFPSNVPRFPSRRRSPSRLIFLHPRFRHAPPAASRRFPPHGTSALTAGCRKTTRRLYPQFTSPHNEDGGRSRCRVQTLKAAIKGSL